MSTQTVVLIPARMESTRLPDKPLKKIAGLPMIVHVAKRSQLATGVDRVVVCTDSPEILMVCEKFGVDVCMTKSTHRNGTERIAEAADVMGLQDDDIIIDVQGDEAFVLPEYIQEVADFTRNTDYECVVPHQMIDEYGNLNRVKMVSHGDRVIYFSRSDIPCYFGDIRQPMKKHLSIIGFRLSGLKKFVASEPTPLENIERVELMRLIELGVAIGTFRQDGVSLSVDTQEDYTLACRMMERDKVFLELIKPNIL